MYVCQQSFGPSPTLPLISVAATAMYLHSSFLTSTAQQIRRHLVYLQFIVHLLLLASHRWSSYFMKCVHKVFSFYFLSLDFWHFYFVIVIPRNRMSSHSCVHSQLIRYGRLDAACSLHPTRLPALRRSLIVSKKTATKQQK